LKTRIEKLDDVGEGVNRVEAVGSVGARGGMLARSIVDPHEMKPVRRRHRPAGGAVAGIERTRKIVSRPSALADEGERADQRAHLRVQE
jgi:hypothetical protein